MKKVSIEDVAFYAREVVADESKVNDLVEKLKKAIEDEQKEKAERIKKKFVAVADSSKMSDEQKKAVFDCLNITPIYLVQVEETYDETVLVSELEVIRKIYMANKKQNKPEAKTLSDVFEVCPAKLFSEREVSRKTKEPVWIVTNE